MPSYESVVEVVSDEEVDEEVDDEVDFLGEDWLFPEAGGGAGAGGEWMACRSFRPGVAGSGQGGASGPNSGPQGTGSGSMDPLSVGAGGWTAAGAVGGGAVDAVDVRVGGLSTESADE